MSFISILILAVLGLFVGSFLNVCIDRLPRGQSIISPPSHCPACNRKLGILDLMPLLSYVWLRGKCRYCRAHIPFRLPLVEGITAILFGFLYWKLGPGLELGMFLVYASLLIIIFFIDLENQLVLDKVTYPGMIIAFVFSFFLPEPGVRSVLVGGAVGSGVMAMIYIAVFLIFRREGLGFGDVKMAALIGLMVGFPLVIEALLLSWISGGVVAAILLAFKIKGRQDMIPSATFMAIAAMVTLLWGQVIYRWYMP